MTKEELKKKYCPTKKTEYCCVDKCAIYIDDGTTYDYTTDEDIECGHCGLINTN